MKVLPIDSNESCKEKKNIFLIRRVGGSSLLVLKLYHVISKTHGLTTKCIIPALDCHRFELTKTLILVYIVCGTT